MTRMQVTKKTFVLLLLGIAAPAGATDSEYRASKGTTEFDYALKGTLAGVFDGGRDLGLLNNKEHQEGYLDFSPWVHWQVGSWGFFFRPEGYVQTGPLLRPSDEANSGVETNPDSKNGYVGIKEAWIEFGGLTSYPGEWIRVGRQRVRQDDAQWWDVDIDAARWVFDTSQFQVDLGGARQFNSYRTDDPPIPRDQRDRTYIFGSIGGEPVVNNRITLRATYAKDDSDVLPALGDTPPADQNKLTRADVAWIGLIAHDHYFDWRRPPHFGYYVTGIGQFGKARRAVLDTDPASPDVGTVTRVDRDDVQAFAAEAMGKICLPRRWPIQFGGGYTFSTGARGQGAGGGIDMSKQFFQTGVESNYSRFTGTRSLIYRYNEAYRAELGNLNVVTAFASIDAGHYDASAIFENFWRTEGGAPVFTDGIVAQPVNGSVDLGQGYDLVFSRYFTIDPERLDAPEGETTSSVVRLKGSLFNPGNAYGDDAHMEYRAMVEVTLWYGN